MVKREPKERARGSTAERSAKFDFKTIFAGGKIGLELSLGSEDRELIGDALGNLQEKIEETSEKMDYRWKVTQRLMTLAIGLATIGQLINWVI